MAGDGLFLGWGPVVRGRELKALDVFQETLTYYGKLQGDGKIDSFEPVLLTPHGGGLAGFILLRGDTDFSQTWKLDGWDAAGAPRWTRFARARSSRRWSPVRGRSSTRSA